MKNIEFHRRDQNHSNSIPSKGEERVAKILSLLEVDFKREKIFDNLKFRENLRFDFYIPTRELLIEFQGQQHYRSNDAFGGEKTFREQKYRDELKREFCDKYGYNLLYINYNASDVEVFSFLNNYLFDGQKVYSANLHLLDKTEPQSRTLIDKPKPKSYLDTTIEIENKFLVQLLPTYHKYEKQTIRKYIFTGRYYPNQMIYDNFAKYINNELTEYIDFIKQLENSVVTNYYSGSYSKSMVDTLWNKVWDRLEKETEEYRYLRPKVRLAFQSHDRRNLYMRNILNIDRRIRKFVKYVNREWKNNKSYYKSISDKMT